ncbi:ARM repeat-containing protein [Aureobasidium namibiae CBS 147.97]|uniref:ARM repeat-containing protein n=1 Tax=Aureobasidium namibiae CBS 147.97 TaxID=1043004 RepID=A0A074WUY0_9PEZI|nr:ARM repeat-containing protein [Aureobasidium namibiae CBS 147.97]KEQ77020.1 ARM repeat-containing protein [Aureobasidium namibiae CBS 147.97]
MPNAGLGLGVSQALAVRNSDLPVRNQDLDDLLAKLSQQQVKLSKQNTALQAQSGGETSPDSSGSGALTNPYATTPRTDSQFNDLSQADMAEMLRLKKELETAQTQIARMDQELSQSRITKHTLEQAMGSQFDSDFDHIRDLRPHGAAARIDNWVQSTEPGAPPVNSSLNAHATQMGPPAARGIWGPGPSFGPGGLGGPGGPGVIGQASNSTNSWALPDPRVMAGARLEADNTNMFPIGTNTRGSSAFGNHLHPWGQFGPHNAAPEHSGLTPPLTPLSFQSMQNMHNLTGMPHPMSDQALMSNMSFTSRSNGTRLSPTAVEFQAGGYANAGWNASQQTMSEPGSYLTNAEPMNYRRLLDRNMSCNWKYIVDKIVHSNDQQASIFLQQKLKVGTQEQKYEIVQAIIDQAYPLMVNRFGNFLVQRCFEHGTPEQIIAIARAIRGNTLNLSMDPFGCHVVQKAFDSVPEEYKAVMVHELLCRIPETVVHRYACHVWQKLFELRWTDTPPQIMKYVNEALHGMWHEVALGETGSLVVQNIFENCLEDDKRPCINEVLASIDVIAHGQFGNWCIQHICEHGAIPDRNHAIDHVLRFATEYSMDQFASKVVEKCLKIGGTEFLDRYLDRVCEAHADRPRMPLIDVAGDQFGNYLIQYILSHADAQRREVVATHIRKHMVSLRGSKYGSRVAMLCSNPAVATRPGPPISIPVGRSAGGFGERPFNGGRNFPYGGAHR